MVYLKKILITTDLSEHSAAAFEHAFSLGLLYASKMFVLHVVEEAHARFRLPGHEEDVQQQSTRLEAEGLVKLNQFVLSHVGTERKIHPIVRIGIPEREILSFAEEEGLDLVVMATHGWTGLKHIVLGSVAEKVVRHSSVPVLTVKPKPMQEPVVRREDVESELHLK
ncbi:MAG: universal stress protein [Ignavibacteriae bacterium]|nr:universal stress protein [Ignavibacteriota bacterium]